VHHLEDTWLVDKKNSRLFAKRRLHRQFRVQLFVPIDAALCFFCSPEPHLSISSLCLLDTGAVLLRCQSYLDRQEKEKKIAEAPLDRVIILETVDDCATDFFFHLAKHTGTSRSASLTCCLSLTKYKAEGGLFIGIFVQVSNLDWIQSQLEFDDKITNK
jgi:hypothetical protein